MIFIAAGSNLPFCDTPSQHLVTRAFAVLDRFVQVKAVSHLYKSTAWPDPADPPFVNAAALVETEMGPHALLAALHAVEAAFGRRRGMRNGPRTLDLDLISYNDVCSEEGSEVLVLPHPRFFEREFVLAPLCDIAPDWRFPGDGPWTGKSVRELLSGLEIRETQRIS